MRPNNTRTVQNISASTEEIRLGLDQNAVAHLIGVLTDLYSDPIKAVVREYSTNARDSHIDAGVERPIEVELPSALNPFFTVKDFGLGLNVDDLTNVYSLYGNSTKRESDLVNGVLGLGCKSALTYALSFNVTAVKGGVRTLAVIAKGEDGVGSIKVLDTSFVDEPNGVTISVPVKERDIRRFTDTVTDFFQYWEPGTVLVNGEQPAAIREDDDWLWIDPDVAVATGYGYSYVVQNNVAYPVDSDKLGVEGNFRVVAYVPAGSVNFTPSREALHYTSLTKETLSVLAEYVQERLPVAIEEKVDGDSSTPWDRLRIINEYRKFAPELAKRLARQYGDGPELPFGRQVIHYNSSAYRHKATTAASISWWKLFDNFSAARTTIVVGFPLRSLSPANRERLEICEGVSSMVILLPDGTDVAGLAGRENIIDWETVLERTHEEPEVKARAERKKRVKTVYRIHRNGAWEAEATIDPNGSPVVYAVRHKQDRWSYGPGHLRDIEHAADAQVVEILSTQVDKLVRENPSAVSLVEYVTAKRDVARKGLTTSDSVTITVERYARYGLFRSLPVERIQDQELVEVYSILQAPRSATLTAALNLGVEIPEHNGTIKDIQTIADRYPLVLGGIDHKNLEDALLYINAKYNSIHNPTV